MKKTIIIILLAALTSTATAKEYHVSTSGSDSQKGTAKKPLRTISAAAGLAQPGDTITVHEGVYRERITPPRGGASDRKPITYRTAKDEKVVVKGSEIVKGWTKLQNDTWKVTIPNTFFGDFNPYNDPIKGDWFNPKGRNHHTGAVYLNGHWLTEAAKLEEVLKPISETPLWFATVDETKTTIWAQFENANPNEAEVEINVRQAVFYPDKTGVNYITVRGFTMMHAATPWAPPTAEQIGLIGTHWSKGWTIEDNDIRYSTCTGITLGKHGDEYDNTSQNSAEGYVETIKRALKRGWSKENIGGHIVRNNRISHCEQAGIVGSMGAVFSTVTNNVIHDIHFRQLFTGAEMAGIKFHAAIDTLIGYNHIYRCGGHGGIWLDWMTQGTRVTRNLLHDNSQDLFVEVNHGPFMVDNNIFLSPRGLLESCGGGAYVHNLFACQIRLRAEKTRDTPYHPPHSTELRGLSKVIGDDERFHNNLIVGHKGLSVYDAWKAVNLNAVGNAYLAGAKPSAYDKSQLVAADFDPAVKLQEKPDGWWLEIALDPAWTSEQKRAIVTTESLPNARIPDLPYVQPDGSPYKIAADYLGKKRKANPFPGPFEIKKGEKQELKVWPPQTK